VFPLIEGVWEKKKELGEKGGFLLTFYGGFTLI